MRYISNMGAIWRLPNNGYDMLLEDIKKEREIDLDKYGKMVVPEYQSLTDTIDSVAMSVMEEDE